MAQQYTGVYANRMPVVDKYAQNRAKSNRMRAEADYAAESLPMALETEKARLSNLPTEISDTNRLNSQTIGLNDQNIRLNEHKLAQAPIKTAKEKQALTTDFLENMSKNFYAAQQAPEGEERLRAELSVIGDMRRQLMSMDDENEVASFDHHLEMLGPKEFSSMMAKRHEVNQSNRSKSAPTKMVGSEWMQDQDTGLWNKYTWMNDAASGTMQRVKESGPGLPDHPEVSKAGRKKASEKQAEARSKAWYATSGEAQAARSASAKNQFVIDELNAVRDDAVVGNGAGMVQAANKVSRFMFGDEYADIAMLGASDIIEAKAMDLASIRFASTKGSVSDAEFNAFMRSVPSLSMTPEGFDVLLSFMEVSNNMNETIGAYADILENDKSLDALPQKKTKMLRDFLSEQRKLNKDRLKEIYKKAKYVKKTFGRPASFKEMLNFGGESSTQVTPESPPAQPPLIQQGGNVGIGGSGNLQAAPINAANRRPPLGANDSDSAAVQSVIDYQNDQSQNELDLEAILELK